MDHFTRPEILQILQSMGIEIPADTKLSEDALEKRLREALNAAQYKDSLPSPFSLKSLPAWPILKSGELDTRARSLHEAVKRGNMDEARQNLIKQSLGASTEPTLYANPFMDLRQTLMGLGMFLDSGVEWCVMQDKEKEQRAVNLRVISVLEVNERTPVFVVLYRAFTPETAMEGVQWGLAQAETNPPSVGNSWVNVTATPLEQKLMLKVLRLNAHLVPLDFHIERRPFEEEFELSVLLPVGPLEFDARAKLTHNQGCAVCGKKATSRCSGCQSVSYCSSACQRSDWSEHKKSCRSLKGGRWCTIRVRSGPVIPGVDMDKMWVGSFNKYTSSATSGDFKQGIHQLDSSAGPPNVWGDRLFMIKLQGGLGFGDPGNFMIYDRKRSFQVFMLREDDYATFGEFLGEMRGPRGGYEGLKMYRWAKRVGEWELSVCLDRQPTTDTNW